MLGWIRMNVALLKVMFDDADKSLEASHIAQRITYAIASFYVVACFALAFVKELSFLFSVPTYFYLSGLFITIIFAVNALRKDMKRYDVKKFSIFNMTIGFALLTVISVLMASWVQNHDEWVDKHGDMIYALAGIIIFIGMALGNFMIDSAEPQRAGYFIGYDYNEDDSYGLEKIEG